MIWYLTGVLPWDCMEHGVACMVEKGDGGGSNENEPGQAGPRERGGTRPVRQAAPGRGRGDGSCTWAGRAA